MNESIELLAPAGNEKTFFAAINHGASAVYLGLADFSARKNAGNFSLENFVYYVAYAHLFGVKVYVAVNTVIKNSELNKYFSLISSALSFGADAFIVQDVFLGRTLKKLFPEIVLHLSTQAGVCNENGAKLAASYGFSRVILARETPESEIIKICKIIETEVFVHGALCTCFSGHCYFSSFIGGNSGNRGACRQPCRKLYKYEGENIKDNYRYALSLADLNLSRKIKRLEEIGVKSLKIEGRMRGVEYVCAACDFYGELLNGKYNTEKLENLKRSYNRGDYTEGLVFGQKADLISDKIQNHKGSFVGTVIKADGKYLTVIFDKYKPKDGDCYKIIDGGKETGNAVAVSVLKNGGEKGNTIADCEVKITYRGKAVAGAKLNLTKDVALTEKYLSGEKKTFPLKVTLTAKKGEPLSLCVNGENFVSDFIVQTALTCATTKSELKENLRKTDVYPFSVEPKIDSEADCFVLKKAINELRARAYKTYFYSFGKNVITLKNEHYKIDFENFYETHGVERTAPVIDFKPQKTAVILNEYSPALKKASINFTDVIYAPSDYNDENARDEFIKKITADFKDVKIYLYTPAYLTSADEEIIFKFIAPFYGLYIESASSIFLAKRLKKQIFGGIELNVTNDITLESLKNEGVGEISLSKELSQAELSEFNGFCFALGDIKVMSLIYCPFGKKCSECKRKNNFYLIDDENRKFKVRRYKLSSCRFEIFNESKLKSKTRFNEEIYDFSASSDSEILKMLNDFTAEKGVTVKQKNAAGKKEGGNVKYTSGNLIKGVI
ncbi:MAG: U32 family peptidase [Candidatus Borkfalkiaceae bacterium]|nr:U32 family peptidase [Christensenellaceae bacterium]